MGNTRREAGHAPNSNHASGRDFKLRREPARAARAGEDGAVVHAVASKQVSPLELYEIQERCFYSLYKLRFAGERLFGPPTKDQMERMIHTPAFRACVERFVKAKESGY